MNAATEHVYEMFAAEALPGQLFKLSPHSSAIWQAREVTADHRLIGWSRGTPPIKIEAAGFQSVWIVEIIAPEAQP